VSSTDLAPDHVKLVWQLPHNISQVPVIMSYYICQYTFGIHRQGILVKKIF